MSEARGLVIEFENQSETRYYIEYNKHDKLWIIFEIMGVHRFVASFKLLSDAKECAEILKRSV